jgi:hypothetical protein
MDVTGEVGTSAINEQQVHEFLSSLFAEDVHAKRVLSLSLATLGAIQAASLSVYAIGQAVAVARGTKGKHGVKQVDRLLSNAGVNVWHLLSLWVPYVLAQRPEAVIALDWTDFDDDDHTTLVASLLTKHGRPTPLVWLTVHKSQGQHLQEAHLLPLPSGLHVLPGPADDARSRVVATHRALRPTRP